MLKEIKFHKSIKNDLLVNQYKELFNNKYIRKSKSSYNKQNKFLNKLVFKNLDNGNYFNIEKDLIKDFNNYKNLVYLKTLEIERISKELDLIPIFITITLPSIYHPFKKLNNNTYIKNKNFQFIEIEERNKKGYKFLNKIFREFYLNVKNNKINKDIKFLKCCEGHKSTVPHLHRIIYINKNSFESFNKQYEKICKKYKLRQNKIEKLKDSKGSSYIIKYLLKSFQEEEIQKIDGWKKLHKIRIFTMSNLPLNTSIFKKIYYSNKEHNLFILEKIKKKEINYKNLFEYYYKNTKVEKIYKDKNKKILKIDITEYSKNSRFHFKQVIKRENKKRYIKKLVKTETNLLKDFSFIKNLYYLNKNEKTQTIYKINKKIKIDYLINGFIYDLDLYEEFYKEDEVITDTIKDFNLFDNLEKKFITKKEKIIIRYKFI